MSPAAFLLALGRRATKPCVSRDPLAEARRFLEKLGDTGEGQALRRVIDTLIAGNGEFVESDVFLFSVETLGLVDALFQARIDGVFYTEEEWRMANN